MTFAQMLQAYIEWRISLVVPGFGRAIGLPVAAVEAALDRIDRRASPCQCMSLPSAASPVPLSHPPAASRRRWFATGSKRSLTGAAAPEFPFGDT